MGGRTVRRRLYAGGCTGVRRAAAYPRCGAFCSLGRSVCVHAAFHCCHAACTAPPLGKTLWQDCRVLGAGLFGALSGCLRLFRGAVRILAHYPAGLYAVFSAAGRAVYRGWRRQTDRLAGGHASGQYRATGRGYAAGKLHGVALGLDGLLQLGLRN
jgi:hypothetical protein